MTDITEKALEWLRVFTSSSEAATVARMSDEKKRKQSLNELSISSLAAEHLKTHSVESTKEYVTKLIEIDKMTRDHALVYKGKDTELEKRYQEETLEVEKRRLQQISEFNRTDPDKIYKRKEEGQNFYVSIASIILIVTIFGIAAFLHLDKWAFLASCLLGSVVFGYLMVNRIAKTKIGPDDVKSIISLACTEAKSVYETVSTRLEKNEKAMIEVKSSLLTLAIRELGGEVRKTLDSREARSIVSKRLEGSGMKELPPKRDEKNE